MILNNKHQSGFTIVETMISMAFVSMLMLGVALVSFQVIKIYRKGNAIKAINQVGRAVSTDLQTTIRSGGGINNDDLVVYPNTTTPVYGALCTGEYSYLWNYGPALIARKNNKPDGRVLYYSGYNINDKTNQIRLIKIRDVSKMYCSLARENKLQDKIDKAKVIELIKPSDGEIGVQDFKTLLITKNPDTNESMSMVSFVLGTYADKNIITSDGSCKTPAGLHSKDDYCAINKFELVVRSIR